MMLLLVAASSIICPPGQPFEAPPKADGEECGGTCGWAGDCDAGLKCVLPENTVPMGLGVAPAGRCQSESVEQVGRTLIQLGAADMDQDDVQEAALEGLRWIAERSSDPGTSSATLAVSDILSVTKQLAAAEVLPTYQMVMAFNDGRTNRVQVEQTSSGYKVDSVQFDYSPASLSEEGGACGGAQFEHGECAAGLDCVFLKLSNGRKSPMGTCHFDEKAASETL